MISRFSARPVVRRRRVVTLFAAAAVALSMSAAGDAQRGAAAGEGDRDGGGRGGRAAYAIGLWGDLPYSDVQAMIGVPNLIADMNRHDLAFSVHDGDLKAGNGTPGSATPTICSDALYEQALGFFNALDAPAMLTPGDNDWTDCDRPSNGGFASLERLDHERRLFFATPFSLGRHRLRPVRHAARRR